MANGPRNGGYDVRILTPGNEVPFAGHPTLGTACLIRRHLVNNQGATVTLNLRVGAIPVSFPGAGSGLLWMSQIEPEFGPVHDAERLVRMLDLTPAEIDAAFPIQEVSTGLPFSRAPAKHGGLEKSARPR